MSVRKANWLFIKDVLSLFRPRIIGLMKRRYQQKINNMKKVNWKKLLGLNLIVMVMIISPFIPGPPNKIVLWFSIMGQIAGTFGLLLVPIGLTWIIIEARRSSNKNQKIISRISHYHLAITTSLFIASVFLTGIILLPNPMPKISFLIGLVLVLTGFTLAMQQIIKWKHNKEYVADHGASFILAVLAISCISFIYLFTSLFILVGIGILPGILSLLFLPIGLSMVIKRIKQLKNDNEKKFSPIPFYFLTVPLIAFFSFIFLVRPASDFSRDFAIKRGQILIAMIEEYKIKTGQYPESIHDLSHLLNKVERPFIMGIENFSIQ